jgi:cell division protein ZapE
MLLGRLFKALFAKGVCLVATSNIEPDDLYKNGLQRLQFLPAIALIKVNTDVVHITSQMDYRLRHLKEAGVFYTPLGPSSDEKMEKTFDLFTLGSKIETSPININGRLIRIKKQANHVVWFEFKDICTIPRSQHDYLEIANLYKTVFISDIPIISENESDTIRLFVNLIDVLYDAKVKLVISAAESVPELYSRGHMILEYARTHSRLIEMQSKEYFAGEY